MQESIGSCSIEKLFFRVVLKLDVNDCFGFNKEIKAKLFTYKQYKIIYKHYLACTLE